MGHQDADRLGARYGGLFGGAALLVEQFPAVHEKAGARVLEGEVASCGAPTGAPPDDLVLLAGSACGATAMPSAAPPSRCACGWQPTWSGRGSLHRGGCRRG